MLAYDITSVTLRVKPSCVPASEDRHPGGARLLEAETDVAEDASKGNAGVAVADYGPPGTGEAGLIAASYPGWEELTGRLSVPYRRLGP